ncbi:hypothetical protein BRD13_05050 [Halobacteriales archaeon SW_5_70_135]|nr:MAG: hypothetical protein BRD13_05050 [Halobacteriales archaeon SW_5_70_135]
MSRSVEKLGSLVFSVLMVTSMFVGVVALGGTAAAQAGNVGNVGPISFVDATPNSVGTEDTVENQQLRFAVNTSEDGDADTAFVEFNESDIVVGSLSPNTALTNDSDGVIEESIQVVDGPDNDGNDDTLRFELGDAGPNATSFGVDTTVTYANNSGNLSVNVTYDDSSGERQNARFEPVAINDRTFDSTNGSEANVQEPAEDPLPRGSTDNTQSSPFAAGGSVEVANVSFGTPGKVRNVSADVSGGTQGDVDPEAVTALRVTLFDNNNTRLESERVPYQGGNTNATVDFGSNVSNVKTVVARVSLNENVDQIDDSDTIDALLTTQVNNSVFQYDTLTTQRSANRTGSLTGEVTDSSNNEIENATVTAVLQSGTYRQNVSTAPNGRYNFGPPSARTLPAASNSYEFRATKPGFTVDVGEESGIENNKTTTQDFLLDPLRVPVEIEVDPKRDSALVGQNNTFTVTVTDQNDERLEDVAVNATAEESDIEFLPTPDTSVDGDGDNSTAVTDQNGQAVFVVTSDTVVTSNIEFEAINDSGENPTTNATKSFVSSGEGSIQGSVINDATTDPVEDASVYAVLGDRYAANTKYDYNFTSEDDDTVFIRLVDNDTGQIIDNDEYDLRVARDTEDDVERLGEVTTNIRKVEQLNASNVTKGSGYAVIDATDNDRIAFNHTRLEPEEYYVQLSLDAGNASDQRVADGGSENFRNVTSRDPIATGSGDPEVYNATANLTLAATEERANATDNGSVRGANPVDSPGWINSYGENTGGTNEIGEYKLNRLPSDFQDGRAYVAIATKTGFDRDFADVYVNEDGELVGTENQSTVDFNLEPVPRRPDRVNITQVGTHPKTAPDPSLVNRFDEVNEEPGDSEFQATARDNQTYDIIRIDTADSEGNVGGEVIVELEEYDDARFANANDDNITGEFVTVIGGSVVDDVSSNEDQIIIDTSNDTTAFGASEGTAFLVYFPTPSTTETVRVNKTAQVRDDVTATDSSNATFVRTVIINETGSLSGIVTDNENQPLPSTTVYTEEFTVEGQQLTLEPNDSSALANADEPLDVLNATWVITGPTGRSIERKGYDLTEEAVDRRFSVETELNVNASNGLTEADGLPTVSLEPPAANLGLTLLTFSAPSASGQYTLPRVPADRSGTPVGATYETVRGVQISPANTDFDGAGDSIAEGVRPNRTQEASVVIPFAEPLGVDVSIVENETPQTAEQGEQIDVEVELQNNNVVTPVDRALSVELRGGTTARNGTGSVTLGPGETKDVTVSINVSDNRETGDQLLAVLTQVAGEIDQQAITIEEQTSSDLESQFDGANGGEVNGEIDFNEVVAVINAYNDDSDDRITEFGTVTDVIQAYNGDGQWPSSGSN